MSQFYGLFKRGVCIKVDASSKELFSYAAEQIETGSEVDFEVKKVYVNTFPPVATPRAAGPVNPLDPYSPWGVKKDTWRITCDSN